MLHAILFIFQVLSHLILIPFLCNRCHYYPPHFTGGETEAWRAYNLLSVTEWWQSSTAVGQCGSSLLPSPEPLPTGSGAGRSAQAELPQAAALHGTATGVFFRSMGGILPTTAFDPE